MTHQLTVMPSQLYPGVSVLLEVLYERRPGDDLAQDAPRIALQTPKSTAAALGHLNNLSSKLSCGACNVPAADCGTAAAELTGAAIH